MNCPSDGHSLQHAGPTSDPHVSSAEPRPRTGASLLRAARLVMRPFAAIEHAVASLFYWQSVSRTIQQLSDLDDAGLKRLGLERSGIIPWVYQSARAEWARKRSAR